MSGWEQITAAEKADALQRVNAAEPVLRFIPDETSLYALELPFYPGGRLLRALKTTIRAPRQWYVQLPQGVTVMDGSVANIHHLNAAAPLKLTEATIEKYLAFRLHFGSHSTLQKVRAEPADYSWQATAVVAEETGVYNISYQISSRGELTEMQKDQLSDQKMPLEPDFNFTQ